MSQSTMNELSSHAADYATWRPAWQRDPKFYKVFAPYRRAEEYTSGRPLPELWDINNGCILWLPPRAEIARKIIPATKVYWREDGFFDHPVVILKVALLSPTAALLTFVPMTSFGDQDLRQAKTDADWRHYLPIFPSAPHPDNDILLHLEDGKKKRGMTENSYINLKETFTLDFTAFRCYAEGQRADGYRQRLTKDSFDQLAQLLPIERGIWIETGALWETFEKYLESQT